MWHLIALKEGFNVKSGDSQRQENDPFFRKSGMRFLSRREGLFFPLFSYARGEGRRAGWQRRS